MSGWASRALVSWLLIRAPFKAEYHFLVGSKMPPPEEVQQLVVIPFSTETLRELSGRGFPDVSHALDSYIRRNLGEVADKLGRGVTVIIINETGNSNSHMSPPPIQPLLWNQRPSVSNEHAPIPAPEAIVLSAEQQEVLDTVRAGGSVFFTGPAGIFELFHFV